jgi:hypothetical protein
MTVGRYAPFALLTLGNVNDHLSRFYPFGVIMVDSGGYT